MCNDTNNTENTNNTFKYELCNQSLQATDRIMEWKNFPKLHKKHEDNLRVLEECRIHYSFKEDDIKGIKKILGECRIENDFTEQDIKEIWQYRDMKEYYLGKPCPPAVKVKLIFYKDYEVEGQVVKLQRNNASGHQGEHVDIMNEQGNLESFNLADVLSVELLPHEQKKQ